MKYLVVGLGNIGDEYVQTRHNVGFEIVDKIAATEGLKWEDGRYGARTEWRFKGRTLVLLKPSTYMNLSGNAVKYWLTKEKLGIEKLLVLVDDLALPFGSLRLKGKGSAGGHNGLKNIEEQLGSSAYARIRFGIGNEFARGGQIDFVLGKWTEEEAKVLPERLEMASEMIKSYVCIGLERTMNSFNNK